MYKTRNLPRSARRDACQSKNTRIDVADALRGIAVAGIILYHSVEHFNIFTQEPIVHPLASDQTQYLFARYWFSNHLRGPLEGLWRKLTWI